MLNFATSTLKRACSADTHPEEPCCKKPRVDDMSHLHFRLNSLSAQRRKVSLKVHGLINTVTHAIIDTFSEEHTTLLKIQQRTHNIRETNGVNFLNKLPAELRIKIYELVVVSPDEKIPILSGEPSYFQPFTGRFFAQPDFPDAGAPALSRVCRQLRNETLPIFYSKNAFVIHLYPSLGQSMLQTLNLRAQFLGWIRSVPPELLERIPCLYVYEAREALKSWKRDFDASMRNDVKAFKKLVHIKLGT